MRTRISIGLAAVLTGATVLLAGTAVASAPASAPASGTAPAAATRRCEAPPVPPMGTPLEIDPATVTAPAGAGQPTDRRTARRVRAGIDNFVACINAGDHLRASVLFTAHFVSTFMGQDSYHGVPLV